MYVRKNVKKCPSACPTPLHVGSTGSFESIPKPDVNNRYVPLQFAN